MTVERTIEVQQDRKLFPETQDLVSGLLESHQLGEDFQLVSKPVSSKRDVVVIKNGDKDPLAISINWKGKRKLISSPQAEQYFRWLSEGANFNADPPKKLSGALSLINNPNIGKSDGCLDEAGPILYEYKDRLPVINQRKPIGAVAFGDLPIPAQEIDDSGKTIRTETVIYSDGLMILADRNQPEIRAGKRKRGGRKIEESKEPILVFRNLSEDDYTQTVHKIIQRISTEKGEVHAQEYLDKFLRGIKKQPLKKALEESFRK